MNKSFEIVLYYTVDHEVKHMSFNVSPGTSILKFLKENNVSKLSTANEICIGIYGKIKDVDYIIKPDDRLELYNNILADPKIRRKHLART